MGDIHPRNKLEVGRRTAMSLLTLTSDKSRKQSLGAAFTSCTVWSTGMVNVTVTITGLPAEPKDTLQAPRHPDGFEVQLPNGSWIDAPIHSHSPESVLLRLPPAATRSLILGLR